MSSDLTWGQTPQVRKYVGWGMDNKPQSVWDRHGKAVGEKKLHGK